MGNGLTAGNPPTGGLEGQKTFAFPTGSVATDKPSGLKLTERHVDKSLPGLSAGNPTMVGEQYQGLNKRVLDFLVRLTLGKYWGKVILTFEGGEIKHVERRESFKP